jgi:hypothetical protein
MKGSSFTRRAVWLSVVTVSLAVGSVPGAFGQALPTPAAPTVSNNTTNGGIVVTIPPKRQNETQYSVTVKNKVSSTTEKKTVDVLPSQSWVTFLSLPHTNYEVTLQAQNSTSTSAESPATTILTLPAPPTDIKGVGGPQKVTVAWTPVNGAGSYQLTLSNGMSFTTNGMSPGCGVPPCYVITGLQTATSYNLIIASIDVSGARGPFSPAVVVRTANVATQ